MSSICRCILWIYSHLHPEPLQLLFLRLYCSQELISFRLLVANLSIHFKFLIEFSKQFQAWWKMSKRITGWYLLCSKCGLQSSTLLCFMSQQSLASSLHKATFVIPLIVLSIESFSEASHHLCPINNQNHLLKDAKKGLIYTTSNCKRSSTGWSFLWPDLGFSVCDLSHPCLLSGIKRWQSNEEECQSKSTSSGPSSSSGRGSNSIEPLCSSSAAIQSRREAVSACFWLKSL